MPAIFDRHGIRFMYPENWELGEEEGGAELDAVTVTSPAGAFLSVGLHPEGTSPETVSQTAIQALKDEYDSLEILPLPARFAQEDAISYELNFIYLDLIGTVRVHAFRTGDLTCLVMIQAESRDFDALDRVFDAICESLKVDALS